MLTPPPGGYDGEDEDLPYKSPATNNSNAIAKGSSHQLPLLAKETTPEYSSATNKGKVITYLDSFYSIILVRCHRKVVSVCNLILTLFHFLLPWLQIKAFLEYVYEILKLKQILQPPIIASVSFGFFYVSF